MEGDDPKQWGVQLQNYINGEIRKGNDIVLPTMDGGLVRLTERSAYKLADNKSTDLKTHQKAQLSDEAYRLKETAASHIDEIILTGEFSHNTENIGGVHENDIGEDGFNSYTAYFENFDGKYYEIPFMSALNGNEETAYSIGKIRERKKPTAGTGSSPRERDAQNGSRLFESSVLQNEGNVNRIDSSSFFKFGVDKKCLVLKRHIPTAVGFGVDGICDRVTRRATPLSRCRSSDYFSLFGTSSGTPASSRDCFSNLSMARVMVCPFSSA